MTVPRKSMRWDAILVALIALLLVPARGEATFSICAVDPATGEVGSAGASCIAGSIILSDVHPDIGVVHTQAYWNGQNQSYARQLMNEGYSPEEIVALVVANDSQGNPTIRQYGVVDLVDDGRSAAYTGVNCTNWKGHITGPTYAIQGNILLGPEIVEDMETAFLASPGSLAERLMAALQAAKRPRADTRCTNKSAISAFLRVARPGDPTNDLYLDLNVNNTSGNTDPIDVLQGLFDEFLLSAAAPELDGNALGGSAADATVRFYPVRPNPAAGPVEVAFDLARSMRVRLAVFDAQGRELEVVADREMSAGAQILRWEPGSRGGILFLRLETGDRNVTQKVGVVR